MVDTKNLIAELIAKYAQGEVLNEREAALLEEWCSLSPENRLVPELLREKPWLDEDRQDPASVPSAAVWRDIVKHIKKTRQLTTDTHVISWRRVKWIAAAVLAGAIAVSGLLHHTQPVAKDRLTLQIYITPQPPDTHQTVLTRADGSQVVLSTVADGTSIVLYNMVFARKINDQVLQIEGQLAGQPNLRQSLSIGRDGKPLVLRFPDSSRVELEPSSEYTWSPFRDQAQLDDLKKGIARLAIAKNSKVPWAVRSPDGSIVDVLGTCFEIDASNERKPKIKLVTGAVRVTGTRGSVVLKPGQQVILRDGRPMVQRLAIDTALWGWSGEPMNFHFKDVSLDQAALAIARYYRLTVYNTDHIKGIRVTVNLPTSKGLENMRKEITRIQCHAAYLRIGKDSLVITRTR